MGQGDPDGQYQGWVRRSFRSNAKQPLRSIDSMETMQGVTFR
jgi:hypothetical protein